MIVLFFITAVIYSSVGFGGGSTYLALLVLFAFPFTMIPKVALLCNLVVVSGALYHYIKNRQLHFRLVLPFLVTSIPAAFWGGTLPISKTFFQWLLAIALLAASLRLFSSKRCLAPRARFLHEVPGTFWVLGLFLGALLGFFSGLVGIGGGIFLSPLLYLLGWGNGRHIAAATSFFIFVNSVAGLGGQMMKGGWDVEWASILPLLIAVWLGGQIGTRLGLKTIPLWGLQRMTAMLILFISIRLLWGLL